MSRAHSIRVTSFTRVTSKTINPASITQDAASFAAIASGLGSLTLLLHRDDTGLHGYLLSNGASGSTSGFKAAGLLAAAIGARAEDAELPETLSNVRAMGWLEAGDNAAVSSESQVGSDPTALVRTLAISMSEGDWVAISFRKPKPVESKRYNRWLSHRFGGVAKPVHHSTGQNAVVCSIFAGADSTGDVRDLLNNVAGALPGFDLQIRTRIASRLQSALVPGLSGAGATVAALAGWPIVSDLVAAADAIPTMVMALPGVGALAFAVARAAGYAPSPFKHLAEATTTGAFPAPASRRRAPAKPQKERTGDKPRAASPGDYPLAASAFLVGPHLIAPLVAPHAGAQSGAATTSERPVPPVLLTDIGPFIGTTGGQRVHLSAADLWGGITIFGQPGSGKSVLTRSLFGWCCMERVSASGRPGYPGRRNALIAFESKGEGTRQYQEWARTMGDETTTIELANPDSFAIDLLDIPGTPTERAEFFANAMQYAVEDGGIKSQSFDTLVRVFTAALSVWPELVGTVPRLDPYASPIRLAYILLGGEGDELGVALANVIRNESIRLQSVGVPAPVEGKPETFAAAELAIKRRDEIKAAEAQLATIYQGSTPAQRRSLTDAPRNKVSAIVKLDSWWSATRKKISWGQILENHASVIINTGNASGRTIEDGLNATMSSLLMFSLQHAIKRYCDGWQEQNRYVTIFSDELSMLAGTSPTVLTWLRDQGRSSGVRPIFATQRPEKLGPEVRRSVMTMTTFITFTQADLPTAEEAAMQVSSTAGEWSASDILHLERFHAVVRTVHNQVRQGSFIARMANFEEDRSAYPAAQGYRLAPPAAAALPAPPMAAPPAPAAEPDPNQMTLPGFDDHAEPALPPPPGAPGGAPLPPPPAPVAAGPAKTMRIVRNADGTTSVVEA